MTIPQSTPALNPDQAVTPALIAHFWAHVEQGERCWLWTGSLTDRGYGYRYVSFAPGKRFRWLAHRLSWTIHFGPIPPGLFVCHNCPEGDNPRCVNPAHLFLGTSEANFRDMVAKGRHARGDRHGSHNARARISAGVRSFMAAHPERVARGERTGNAKLTAEQVRAIRRAYAAGGITQRALAERFDIAQAAIWRIIHRQGWAHVSEEGS